MFRMSIQSPYVSNTVALLVLFEMMARLVKAVISGSSAFGPCVHAVRQHAEIWAKLTQSMAGRSLMLASMGASATSFV